MTGASDGDVTVEAGTLTRLDGGATVQPLTVTSCDDPRAVERRLIVTVPDEPLDAAGAMALAQQLTRYAATARIRPWGVQ